MCNLVKKCMEKGNSGLVSVFLNKVLVFCVLGFFLCVLHIYVTINRQEVFFHNCTP